MLEVKVSSIRSSTTNYNKHVYNNNQKVSFYGRKTVFAEKSRKTAGRLGSMLMLVILSPLMLAAKIILDNKNEKIDIMAHEIKNEYEKRFGNFKIFENKAKKMNKFINKHVKNQKYAQFVKEATVFLLANFERNQGYRDEFCRLMPFEDDNLKSEHTWNIFMYTVNKSAKAAMSKNHKGIDIDKLNERIESAQKIMQKSVHV